MWGFKPKVRQMLPAAEADTPARVAIVLVDRWVFESGGSIVVSEFDNLGYLVVPTGSSWCVTEGSHTIEGESPYPL
jgi:hypothetical protein